MLEYSNFVSVVVKIDDVMLKYSVVPVVSVNEVVLSTQIQTETSFKISHL